MTVFNIYIYTYVENCYTLALVQKHTHTHAHIYIYVFVRGVMATVVTNGHSDQSSNPGQGCLHFTYG